MAGRKYTYRIEFKYPELPDGSWETHFGFQDVSPEWARGWIAHARESPGPRLAMRLVRSDGKVQDDASGSREAGLGMIAGFPTWQQYAHAAVEVLKRARETSERHALNAQRHRRDPEWGVVATPHQDYGMRHIIEILEGMLKPQEPDNG